MLVVTDPSKRGILTAKRIEELSDELDISFKKIFLILNRVKPENEEELINKVNEIGLEIAGIIYEDETVADYDMEGTPLINLPDDSGAVTAARKIMENLRL